MSLLFWRRKKRPEKETKRDRKRERRGKKAFSLQRKEKRMLLGRVQLVLAFLHVTLLARTRPRGKRPLSKTKRFTLYCFFDRDMT